MYKVQIKMKVVIFSLVLILINNCAGLDNGLALTPPMGWLTWERYRCITDCKNRPDECISEKLILKVADLLVSEGYAAAGYEYVGIDDCWLEMERDEQGRLVPDRERFPNGMKFVGDYLHSKGLKFGIYQDFGSHTCAGYPGIEGHLEIDAKTFGEWGADYVKLDGCYVDVELMDEGYPEFGQYLNATGRPMLYSCSWPVYQEEVGMMPDWESIIKTCNMWRNYDDIDDSWSSVTTIMEYFGNNSERLASYAGPGHWNDPDMLIIGNFGLSYDQSKAQMAVWAILAAPLLMSTDLANVRPLYKEILLNKQIIEVDQDPLGIAGTRILVRSRVDVWRRQVLPIVNDRASLVFAFVNFNIDGAPRDMIYSFAELQIPEAAEYNITDLFAPGNVTWELKKGLSYVNYYLGVRINPTGVQMLKVVVAA